jgi:murein L,D-transpeptidase YafK
LWIIAIVLFYFLGKDIWYPYYKEYFMHKDIKSVECKECNLTHIDPDRIDIPPVINLKIVAPKEKLNSKQRLKRHLADSDFVFYPKKLTLIGMKDEKLLEVWGELHGKWVYITTYPFTGFSGRLGPKYREGDRQIPEGIYGISYLNPNSKFHLSMRVNYPNRFDKKMARREKRTNLGGDIMIHGSNRTTGCIPIGDDKIEELYFLAEKAGIGNIKVILSPVNFRKMEVEIKNDKHPWLKELYTDIKKEMRLFSRED